ncbi:hypothetical protein BDI4_410045 [Burkholderia diffusa]|nr:hypothetical protein BDI4_410045 [Burkholderia diffusa]
MRSRMRTDPIVFGLNSDMSYFHAIMPAFGRPAL